MIPNVVKEFLSQPPVAMVFGTRDAQFKPQVGRAVAAKISDDGTHITIYTPKFFADVHTNNLNNNGKVAFTAVSPMNHASYQFKGQYVSTQECGEGEYTIVDHYKTAFVVMLEQYYGPGMAAAFGAFPIQPAVGITFRVEEVFNQTPGPGAGNKIN